MTGEDENSFALIASRQVVLQPLIPDKAARSLRGVARHLAELGQQPTKIAVQLAQNLLPFGGTFPGKRQAKIKVADTRQAWSQQQRQPADERTDIAGNAPGRQAQELYRGPHQHKFQSSPHPLPQLCPAIGLSSAFPV